MNANFARSYTPDHSDPDPSDSDDKGDEGNNNNGSSGSGDRGAGDEPPLDENEKDTSSTSSTTTADDMNMLNEDQEETWNAPGDQHAAAHAWDEGGESETAVAPSPPLTLSPAQNIFEEELMQELRATLGIAEVEGQPAPSARRPGDSSDGEHGPGDEAAGPPTNSPSNPGALGGGSQSSGGSCSCDSEDSDAPQPPPGGTTTVGRSLDDRYQHHCKGCEAIGRCPHCGQCLRRSRL